MKGKVEVSGSAKAEVVLSTESSELTYKDIKFKTSNPCDLNAKHLKFEMPVQDEISAFHALSDIQALVLAYTLRQVKVELISGEEGAVGATYEGFKLVGEASRPHLLRYRVEEISDTPGNRVIDLTVEESDRNGLRHRYSWRFEVRPGAVVLNQDTTYFRPIPKVMIPFLVTLAPLFLIILIIGIPCVVYQYDQPVRNVFPIYRHLHDFTPSGTLEEGLSGPTSSGKTPEVTELHQLFEMLKAGALTQDEFATLKQKVLDGST